MASRLRATLRSAAEVAFTIWGENVGFDRLRYFGRGLVWQVRKRRGQSFITTLPNGAKARVYPASAFSGVFYCRWLERKDMLFIRTHASLAPSFVDVGANVGLFSALLFDKFSHFVLFEPAPSSFSALRETCELNPSVRCTSMNIAVADQRSQLLFLDEGGFSTTSRVVTGARDGSAAPYQVPSDTLDNALHSSIGNFVLKVDVEGFEEQVFRGASGHFRSRRVRLVMFERLGRTNIDSILSFLGEFGYVVFFVSETGEILRDDQSIRRPLVNLFACPDSVFHSLTGGTR